MYKVYNVLRHSFACAAAELNASHVDDTRDSTPLPEEKLALFKRRLKEGYDVPDQEYEAWKMKQGSGAMPATDTATRVVDLTASYDMGWQKRGKAMNSLTGVGVNIGQLTGSVIGVGTCNLRCITCEVAEREGRPPKKHDCRRNHWGSSKSMEASVAVDLAKAIPEATSGKARLGVIIGDEDCSTIKHVNDAVGGVKKYSDVSHAKRSLGKKLYDVKARDKTCTQLSKKVIKYFQKMFAYALQDCAGDVTALRKTLLTIVPHAFGEHAGCDEKWCGGVRSPETYQHTDLPNRQDVTCMRTKAALDEIFQGLVAQAEKLAPRGSSQANESFNNIRQQGIAGRNQLFPGACYWGRIWIQNPSPATSSNQRKFLVPCHKRPST